jgi:hypothetical protein
MEQSPSSEANSSSASHEIPCKMWYPTVPYHADSSLPPVTILSHINPVSAQMPHPTSLRSIFILSSHLCPGLTTGLFPSSMSRYQEKSIVYRII